MLGAISLRTGKTTIFIPKFPKEYVIIMGTIHPPSHFQISYAVDEVLYLEDVNEYLASELSITTATTAVADADAIADTAKIYLMRGVNSDSGLSCKPATWEGDGAFVAKVDTAALFPILATARVTKSVR